MSKNFKIDFHNVTDNLFIDLHGDFDGNSAWELINKIMLKDSGLGTIFIDTEKVHHVEPFGKVTLETVLGGKEIYKDRVIFTGPNGSKIGWDGCRLLNHHSGKKHTCKGNCKNCTCRHS